MYFFINVYRSQSTMLSFVSRKSREYCRLCSLVTGSGLHDVMPASPEKPGRVWSAPGGVLGTNFDDSHVYSLSLRSYHKETTGIVGLPMNEKAREDLKDKIGSILDALESHGIPSSSAYRQAVEKRCRGKMDALLRNETTDEELEKLFGRQLEQEIKLCDDELSLIPNMAEWKPWEADESKPITVIEDAGEQDDVVVEK